MFPETPKDAFGSYAELARDTVVEVVRNRHTSSAEAHNVANTRSSRGYSTLWHDLSVDTSDAFANLGFTLHTLSSGRYQLPIINNCLLFVWRVPITGDPADFASSEARVSAFNARRPDPPLFDFALLNLPDSASPDSELQSKPVNSPEAVMGLVDDKMPVVIARFRSSPWQLQDIVWAVAELDIKSGEVNYRGEEIIRPAEPEVEPDVSEVESFSSGSPVEAIVEPREQEGIDPDVR